MVDGGEQALGGKQIPTPPGHPLITPHVVLAAAALGGLTLTTIAGFAPESLAPPLKLMAFAVLQNPDIAFRVAVGALAIHVAEAIGTVVVGVRRGYDLPALAWWALLAFLCGYVGIDTMNKVHAGKTPKLLASRFHLRISP